MSTTEKVLKLEKDAFDAVHDQHETGKNMREVISEGLIGVLDDLARAECIHCKRGDPPSILRRSPKVVYSHRVPEGRNGNLINMLCRATEIRKLMDELLAHKESGE